MATPDYAQGSILGRTLGFVGIWTIGSALVAVAATGRGVWAAILGYSRFVWLGRISYGLYMYHEIAFWGQHRLFESLGWFPNQEALGPIASAVLTIALAAASYYGYERPFLKWKRRWSRVASRPV